MNDPTTPLLLHLRKIKRSLLTRLFCFPISLLSLLLLLLLFLHAPFWNKTSPESDAFSPENFVGETSRRWSTSSSSSVMYAVEEKIPPLKLKTHLLLLQKSNPLNSSSTQNPKLLSDNRSVFKILQPTFLSRQFSTRVKKFFNGSSSNSNNSSCKVRFFMTWISSLDSFDFRELFTIESVFKTHPNACLVIISSSMDSRRGSQLLKPFQDQGFRVSAISPNFNYMLKNTFAEAWFDRLRKGNVDPGEVSLGQNLSNLLRLAVLYKFGGIYIDADVIVLKSFSHLRNTIGAQTIDLETGNWSRLNNAVMIFDKMHPLLFKFIEEFALTFDGNKWGHNGPYLVSRVASRVSGRPGFNFTVLPPPAFYPVNWSRVQSLFHGPRNETQSKWISAKVRQIHSESFVVHLWNKQSRKMKVEEGSIIDLIMLDCCIFCNSSVSALQYLLQWPMCFDTNERIFVGYKAKRLLERAVWNDTSFLVSIDVMYYSLLVGVDEEKHELVLGNRWIS